VSQRQLNNLADLGKLFAHTTNIVIANVIEALLVVALDRLALAKDDCVRGNNTKISWVHLHNLEFHSAHATTNKEEVVLTHGPIGLEKIGLKERLKEIASHSLDGVVYWQHVDALAILDIGARLHIDDIAKANA